MSPRLSSEYGSGLVDASKSALLELDTMLGVFKDSIVLVGGWAPYFLIDEYGREPFSHVGSIDIDLAVDPDAIDEDAYAGIIDRITDRGYSQRMDRAGNPILFSYTKPIVSEVDGREYPVQVDFLTSRDLVAGTHRHRTIQGNLRARVCEECELAFTHNILKPVSGVLPGNGEIERRIRMVDIVGSIGMKGIVLGERYKEKDAYDLYTVITQCDEGPSAVAGKISDHLDNEYISRAVGSIREAFGSIRGTGPDWVAEFLYSVDAEAKKRKIAEVYAEMKQFLDNLPE